MSLKGIAKAPPKIEQSDEFTGTNVLSLAEVPLTALQERHIKQA